MIDPTTSTRRHICVNMWPVGEVIFRQQLAGLEKNPEDIDLISEFAATLVDHMLIYGGNLYLTAPDGSALVLLNVDVVPEKKDAH